MLKIGVDTLFEDPYNGSSAVNFLVEMIRGFAAAPGDHSLVVLGSRHNRELFEPLIGGRGRFVVAGISNEVRPARILTQQLVEPVVASRAGVDVMYAAGNTFPLRWRKPVVLKINSLHHIHMPGRIGHVRSLWRRLMFHESARRADFVIANTRQTREELITHMQLDPDRVRLVYEAVGDEFVPDAAPGEGEAVRRKFGLAPDYILFAATLWAYKNADLALDAFLAAEPHLPTHVSLVIVGADDQGAADRLKAKAAAAGKSAKVRYLGPVKNTEMPMLFRHAGVFLYPSSSETFGKPILEAYRTRTPVLAADIPTLREIGQEGAWFLPLQTKAWTDALVTFYRDPSLRDKLSRAGEARGWEFSWQRVVAGTLELLHAAVARHAASRRA